MQNRQSEKAQRKVGEEDPVPAQHVDEEPADQRPDHGGDAEDGPQQPLRLPPLTRGQHVGDHRHRHHDQPAAAQPLDRAARDQHLHRLRQSGQRRPGEKDEYPDLYHQLSAVEIAQLARHRRADGRGQKVGRDDPGHVVHAAEVGHHDRDRRRDDGLTQRGKEQRHRDCGQRDTCLR